MNRKQLILVAAICGGAAALGAILPWASVETFMGSHSSSGINSGMGVFVLLLGLAGGAAALLVHLGKAGQIVKLGEREHLLIAAGCLGVALLITLIQFMSDAYKTITVMEQTMGASRGIGLWLDLLATAGGAVAAFLASRQGAAATPKA